MFGLEGKTLSIICFALLAIFLIYKIHYAETFVNEGDKPVAHNPEDQNSSVPQDFLKPEDFLEQHRSVYTLLNDDFEKIQSKGEPVEIKVAQESQIQAEPAEQAGTTEMTGGATDAVNWTEQSIDTPYQYKPKYDYWQSIENRF